MTTKKQRTRPGQKSIDFGAARELIESWCRRNAYLERNVLVAGWMAIHVMDHETRALFFDAAERALADGTFNAKELEKVANATGVLTRPVGSSTANVSRPVSGRAG